MSRTVAGYPETCRFFLRGKCNRGNDCRWSHEIHETIDYPSPYGGYTTYPEPPVIDPLIPPQAPENNNQTRCERPPRRRRERGGFSAKGKGKAPVRSLETDGATESGSGAGFAAASAAASSSWHRPGPSRRRNAHESAAGVPTCHEIGQVNTPLPFDVQNLVEEAKRMHSSVSHPLHNAVKL